MQRIFALTGLLMQEMRAPQAHRDLGMTTEMDELLGRELLATPPTPHHAPSDGSPAGRTRSVAGQFVGFDTDGDGLPDVVRVEFQKSRFSDCP